MGRGGLDPLRPIFFNEREETNMETMLIGIPDMGPDPFRI